MMAPTAEPAMMPRAAPEVMMMKPKVERVIVGIVPFSQEANIQAHRRADCRCAV